MEWWTHPGFLTLDLKVSVTSPHILSERTGPAAVAQSNKGCKMPVPA